MIACHTCDNPRCVNPDHLYVGTDLDNSRDAVERGRLAVGERNFNARLTEDQVREMRRLSGLSYAEMARMYGVSRPTATRAYKGDTWRHVQ
jgi:DNA invertase Pin-like site-specific DNA recombinase